MSLIDKDKTVEAVATYLFINDAIRSAEPMKIRDYLVFAESILKDVPEVDAIPREYYEKVVGELCRKHTEEIASMPDIVRCMECKYWNTNGKYYDKCEYHGIVSMSADDYCSYGEREGE